ncbi:MAG TPA: hypothetical protein DCR43_04090 [Bacteroidales bacterium]|nr:MAG: hypothetical protein A2X11_01420 [Bacteroidetes bacterium GWE2_42_24]OFY27352.1 MAG: hypothetical protein A2X09_00625 [Bacteroidetes bacterium GWF2_43_11]HAQ65023.1 hypothetical protein [Bacteroidales bacterium]HBZ65897.1 hypothetical protein [Bacteroidales bacterium]
MEVKDSFFDFLNGTAGTVEVEPAEDVRRIHLGAMQKEMIRLRRLRHRNWWLVGLCSFFMVVLLIVLLWPGSEEPVVAPSGISGTEQSRGAAGNDKKEALSTFLMTGEDVVACHQVSAIQSKENSPEVEAEGLEAPISQPEVSNGLKASGTEGRQPENAMVVIAGKQRRGLTQVQTIQTKPCSQIKQPVILTSIQIRPVPDVAVRRNDDTIPAEKAMARKTKIWMPGFSLGLHYTPEYMFNTLDQTDRLVHNAGLEIAWRKRPFTVRTGISLSVATGVTELAYHYNENLGVMQKLDSVAFAYDPEGRKIVPSWYFSERQVFDTAEDISVSSIRKRYTYLQIPLILGYDIMETGRFSLGFRAGPVLQILTATRQLDEEPDNRNNRIISINQLTPGRLTTHWQALFGINVTVILSRRMNLETEPHIKYYFNSVYEKAATTGKPWSIEWRTALIYKF